MKALILLLFVVAAMTDSAIAGTYDLRGGTIDAPDDFVFKHTGTKDSFMGTLTRKSDGFTIAFDVGFMAGTHMHDGKKAECTFYRNHQVGGVAASTGIERVADGQKIVTTVYAPHGPTPANFWADIRKESDIAEFILIVNTYKPEAATMPLAGPSQG